LNPQLANFSFAEHMTRVFNKNRTQQEQKHT